MYSFAWCLEHSMRMFIPLALQNFMIPYNILEYSSTFNLKSFFFLKKIHCLFLITKSIVLMEFSVRKNYQFCLLSPYVNFEAIR